MTKSFFSSLAAGVAGCTAMRCSAVLAANSPSVDSEAWDATASLSEDFSGSLPSTSGNAFISGACIAVTASAIVSGCCAKEFTFPFSSV
jgi:hypothetical protein